MPKKGTNNEAMKAQTAARKAKQAAAGQVQAYPNCSTTRISNSNLLTVAAMHSHNNTVLTREENKISQATVQNQLREAPGPNETTKTGYSHKYYNEDKGPDGHPLFRVRTNSSTTSYREYPVMPTGDTYAFDKKPKAKPGPFRAITNQNKTFKGVISHDGKDGNPNAGYFHRAMEHRT